jgi:hypothetical protein
LSKTGRNCRKRSLTVDIKNYKINIYGKGQHILFNGHKKAGWDSDPPGSLIN